MNDPTYLCYKFIPPPTSHTYETTWEYFSLFLKLEGIRNPLYQEQSLHFLIRIIKFNDKDFTFIIGIVMNNN